jgi:hypothetical protein
MKRAVPVMTVARRLEIRVGTSIIVGMHPTLEQAAPCSTPMYQTANFSVMVPIRDFGLDSPNRFTEYVRGVPT